MGAGKPTMISPLLLALACCAFAYLAGEVANAAVFPGSVQKRPNSSNVNCTERPDPGPCYEFLPRFYYDSESGDCRRFIYGGCGGNSNNFEFYEECEETCAAPQVPALPLVQAQEYKNETTGRDLHIPPFPWGRAPELPALPVVLAQGYKNETTGRDLHIPPFPWGRVSSSLPVCYLPPVKGPCDAFQTRFFYNVTAGVCEPFLFSGCRSNGNNFRTLDECQVACEPREEVLPRA
ncbi:thrombin inhibitor hemalin-like isoform X2 [Haemaphysalis longicornis]